MSSRKVILISLLLVVACRQAPSPSAASDPPASTAPPTATYACADGSTVEASYPTTDTATILRKGRSIELTAAVSASGARYVGGGWEWWTKGMTKGTLSPLKPGESIASAPGVICTAR